MLHKLGRCSHYRARNKCHKGRLHLCGGRLPINDRSRRFRDAWRAGSTSQETRRNTPGEGRHKGQELNEALSEQKRLGELLVEKGVTTSGKVKSALAEQAHVRKAREKSPAKDEGISSIRVPADKLDVLVNLVGELVTVQARLTRTASLLNHPELASVAEEVERLTGRASG